MEVIGLKEEPYCTMSPAMLAKHRWTQLKSTISSSSEKIHIPLSRNHFICTQERRVVFILSL